MGASKSKMPPQNCFGSKNTRWKVSFVWPTSAHYWVIELGDTTSTASWVSPITSGFGFSRVKNLDPDLQKGICERLVGHGYRPERIEWTKHSEDPSVYVKPEQKRRGWFG